MFPNNIIRSEAQARARLLRTESYRVRVDLTGVDPDGAPLASPESTFVSRSRISFTALAAGETYLDAIAERLYDATLDGEPLTDAFADGRLSFAVEPGQHVLEVTGLFRYSRSGLGLHRFVDPADQRVYLYTQFEVAEARRMYACFEQPDLKATFAIEVLAPQHWTVASNSAAVEPEDLGTGFARWSFATTKPMSTYITAIVAGEYHRVHATLQSVDGPLPASLLCRQSMVDFLDADRILAITQAGFEVFERQFGYPYPFGSYDQAFVPEYNMGAMENAGCVTFRDEYLFRSRVTRASYDSRDNTILHELAHMWFGDLVTMTWWDDLWLNESFAEWASHFAQGEISGEPELTWATFSNARKIWALRQDQLPSTHPVAADMVDLEAVEENFDGITYAKGASALRQLVAFVGREEFLAGVRDYFAAHAFGNTQLSDLLAALERTSGRDLSGWSAEWLEVPGVNLLRPEFTLDEAGRFASFALLQTAPPQWPTLRHHRLAVGCYRLVDGVLTRTERFELDVAGERTEVRDLVGLEQPDLLLINDDDLTYTKVRLDERSLRTLIEHLPALADPLARAVCWGAAWDMCRDAELGAADYLELALRGVASETDLTAVQRILGQVSTAITRYVPAERRPELGARAEAGLARLLRDAQAGSDHQLAFARALAATVSSSAGLDLIQGWLDGEEVPDGLVVDTDLRWILLTQLARRGRAEEAAIDAELRRDNTIAGLERASGARAARPTSEAKAEAWWRAVDDPAVPNETQLRIVANFWQVGQDDVLAEYRDRYLQMCEDISAARGVWAERGYSLQSNALSNLFPAPMADAAWLDGLGDWMAGRQLSEPVRRTLAEEADDAARTLRAQAVNAGAPGDDVER